MQAVDNLVLGPIESVSGSLGLRTPGMRGLAAAAVTAGVLYYVKPRLMFAPDGTMREWALMPGQKKKTDGFEALTPYGPTALPLWLASAGVGTAVYLLV